MRWHPPAVVHAGSQKPEGKIHAELIRFCERATEFPSWPRSGSKKRENLPLPMYVLYHRSTSHSLFARSLMSSQCRSGGKLYWPRAVSAAFHLTILSFHRCNGQVPVRTNQSRCPCTTTYWGHSHPFLYELFRTQTYKMSWPDLTTYLRCTKLGDPLLLYI